MARLKTLGLIIFLICIGFGAKAHDFKVGNLYYEIISSQNKTVRVCWTFVKYGSANQIKYNYEDQTTINIPANVTYNGKTYAVVEIQNNTFLAYNSQIKYVTLHNNLKTIGDNAFKNLTKLKSITIPESVTSIGSGAFDGCTGLDTVYWKAKTVTDAFKNSTIRTLVIGDSVKVIQSSAFENCENLKTVTIGLSVDSLAGDYWGNGVPFNNCNNIETLYYNAKHIKTYPSFEKGKNSYYNTYLKQGTLTSSNLKKVIIGDSVEFLPVYFLSGSVELEIVEIGKNVQNIQKSAFAYCPKLKDVSMPNEVTYIGEGCFEKCYALDSIYIMLIQYRNTSLMTVKDWKH